jgi:hypothetical protein
VHYVSIVLCGKLGAFTIDMVVNDFFGCTCELKEDSVVAVRVCLGGQGPAGLSYRSTTMANSLMEATQSTVFSWIHESWWGVAITAIGKQIIAK